MNVFFFLVADSGARSQTYKAVMIEHCFGTVVALASKSIFDISKLRICFFFITRPLEEEASSHIEV
jgi:hypothetical protein